MTAGLDAVLHRDRGADPDVAPGSMVAGCIDGGRGNFGVILSQALRGPAQPLLLLARTSAGPCQVGEFLGILGDQVALINRDPLAVACELVARMLSVGGELGTVLLGEDAPDGFGDALIGRLRAAHPEVEMVAYAGEVPGRVLLVGVE